MDIAAPYLDLEEVCLPGQASAEGGWWERVTEVNWEADQACGGTSHSSAGWILTPVPTSVIW